MLDENGNAVITDLGLAHCLSEDDPYLKHRAVQVAIGHQRSSRSKIYQVFVYLLVYCMFGINFEFPVFCN